MYSATNVFHFAVCLFSNRSQMTSKCGKNKKRSTRSASVSLLSHFDIFCDLRCLLNRCTATWNLLYLFYKLIQRQKNCQWWHHLCVSSGLVMNLIPSTCWPTHRLTHQWHMANTSDDTLPTRRPTHYQHIGRQTTKVYSIAVHQHWPTVGWLSADCQPTHWPMCWQTHWWDQIRYHPPVL